MHNINSHELECLYEEFFFFSGIDIDCDIVNTLTVSTCEIHIF